MNFRNRGLVLLFTSAFIGCNKLVQVPEPISSVTAGQVFSTDANATAAMLGIYSYMSGTQGQSFSNVSATYLLGRSSDELTDESPGGESQDPFLVNDLTVLNENNFCLNYFWQPAYYDIYCANAIISGVQSSTGMSLGVKKELTGEAKFVRAFCYFYLTNIFGALPLDLSVDFNQTVLLAKVPQVQIYQQIIADLLDAENLLPGDFSLAGGQAIRANKWAATALLARVYLYQQNWDSAASAATAVINSGQFTLVPLPLIPEDGFPSSDSDVFQANSTEAILQLQTFNNSPYATQEGNLFDPGCPTCSPSVWLTPQLLGAFEPNDLRRADWVDSTNYGGVNYYYPFKYQIQSGSSWPALENYTLLRLAEQYLIRAEAEANLGDYAAATTDLNTIRARAGLPPTTASGSGLLGAIQQEWRIEFFAEWGHRWLDLKRWEIAIDTLKNTPYKRSNIDSTQLLYPIPVTEIQTDPNLTQNPGYNNNQ